MGLNNFGFIGEEYVIAVRKKFLNDYYSGHEEEFYDEDIKKITDDDWYIKRFIIAAYKNLDEAAVKLAAAMKWRKEQGVRKWKALDFPREFYETGALFIYEEDKHGAPALIMRLKFIKRIPEMMDFMKRFGIYNCFHIDEQTNGSGWVLVLDFSDCSYSSYQNIDLLHYFITTMHSYFPAGMDYVLSVDLPWVLSSFWGLVKMWVPEKRRDMVQFCSKSSLLEYFDASNLPPVLGGYSKKKYKTCPDNCPSAFDVGMEMGLDKERCNEIYIEYQPLLEQVANEAE